MRFQKCRTPYFLWKNKGIISSFLPSPSWFSWFFTFHLSRWEKREDHFFLFLSLRKNRALVVTTTIQASACGHADVFSKNPSPFSKGFICTFLCKQIMITYTDINNQWDTQVSRIVNHSYSTKDTCSRVEGFHSTCIAFYPTMMLHHSRIMVYNAIS